MYNFTNSIVSLSDADVNDVSYVSSAAAQHEKNGQFRCGREIFLKTGIRHQKARVWNRL
jgi:hypothetical protein